MKITLSVLDEDRGTRSGTLPALCRRQDRSRCVQPAAVCGVHRPDEVDAFAHPFWNRIREHVTDKAVELRRQGCFGAAMLPMDELEYTGITDLIDSLDTRFRIRPESTTD